VDDLEEDYKIEKIKKIIDVIIINIVYIAFIQIFLNEKFKFISKYLNINL
jgi:hypothetical protein